MSKTPNPVIETIHTILDQLLTEGEIVDPIQLTLRYLRHITLADDSPIETYVQGRSLVDHHLWSDARRTVANLVTKFRRGEDGHLAQRTLPGMEHIQLAYLVRRDGEDLIVPTTLLTREEAEAICATLEAESMTKLAHAKELRAWAEVNLPSAVPETAA